MDPQVVDSVMLHNSFECVCEAFRYPSKILRGWGILKFYPYFISLEKAMGE